MSSEAVTEFDRLSSEIVSCDDHDDMCEHAVAIGLHVYKTIGVPDPDSSADHTTVYNNIPDALFTNDSAVQAELLKQASEAFRRILCDN